MKDSDLVIIQYTSDLRGGSGQLSVLYNDRGQGPEGGQLLGFQITLIFLFPFLDTTGVFEISPQTVDILPLKTASFTLTFKPVSSNSKQLGQRPNCLQLPFTCCVRTNDFIKRPFKDKENQFYGCELECFVSYKVQFPFITYQLNCAFVNRSLLTTQRQAQTIK